MIDRSIKKSESNFERGELLLNGAARRALDFRAPLQFRAEQDKSGLRYNAQLLATRLMLQSGREGGQEPVVRGSHILALGLLHEVFRIVIQKHELVIGTKPSSGKSKLPVPEPVEKFGDAFPRFSPDVADSDKLPPDSMPEEKLAKFLSNEILLTHISNQNPACEILLPIIDDSELKSDPGYLEFVQGMLREAGALKAGNSGGKSLLDMLLEPIRAHPNSLLDQLEFLAKAWKDLLGDFLLDVHRGLDILREENSFRAGGNTDLSAVARGWTTNPGDPEAYSRDQDWMPELVLIAKNTYVWLAQLSESYEREIRRLDDIPEEEFQRLRGLGINGLWLIGVWERSSASQKIKQLMGAEDAAASAYSLNDYVVAQEFGGQPALEGLRARAWKYGVRLASDMVPNHMGIDSKWVLEHPEWFLQIEHPPFPSYSYSGPNLSKDGRAEIQIEDHYYDKSDAAVVFRRRDTDSGSVAYLYHGNDGTSMPWNDTAQLNYASEAVREQIVQTVLSVARQFPIIRFDAAMTLAKRHIQRLWFPIPGSGGAIPTRSSYGLSQEEFDRLIPIEFWRQVVDRVAAEVPDTLLLAEAFWMMEGYFVRTLGMHRVYNSAFMHMLRDERNAEYRDALATTLATNPQILKRYVNFMNNPDEESAASQFGKGDKYFGICVLMATLPGLPMVGHGQFEGLSEKYGMEFLRPRTPEQVDWSVERRHWEIIAPLLHRRRLFAGVTNFRLYNCVDEYGALVQDVFAYSNRSGSQSALVVYHNRFAETDIWVRESTPYLAEDGGIRNQTLADALGLVNEIDKFAVFKDTVSSKEYIYDCRQVYKEGLPLHLNAYDHRVLTDLRITSDADGHFRRLVENLGGQGVDSVESALVALRLQPLLLPFAELFGVLATMTQSAAGGRLNRTLIQSRVGSVVAALLDFVGNRDLRNSIETHILERLMARYRFFRVRKQLEVLRPRGLLSAARWLATGLGSPGASAALAFLTCVNPIGLPTNNRRYWEVSRTWAREWGLDRLLRDAFRSIDISDSETDIWLDLIVAGSGMPLPQATFVQRSGNAFEEISTWLNDSELAGALGVNEFAGFRYFNGERMECWIWLQFARAAQECLLPRGLSQIAKSLGQQYSKFARIRRAVAKSDYRVDALLAELEEKGR